MTRCPSRRYTAHCRLDEGHTGPHLSGHGLDAMEWTNEQATAAPAPVPVCGGKVMTNFKGEDIFCGRPPGHAGDCISEDLIRRPAAMSSPPCQTLEYNTRGDGVTRYCRLPYLHEGPHDMVPVEPHVLTADELKGSHVTTAYVPRKQLLEKAATIVAGQRDDLYGPPTQNFTRTSGMLTSLFEHKLKDGMEFTPADVARIQICLKLSRMVVDPHADSWLDTAGYAACGYECDVNDGMEGL